MSSTGAAERGPFCIRAQCVSCTIQKMRYPFSMRSIIIWGIAIIIVVGGGIGAYIYMNPSEAPSDTAATGTPQVQGQDVKVGTGDEAKPNTVVSVLYVGKLADGTIFDSSAAHNNEPLTFTLGAEGIIPGFQIGVNGMKVGGQRLLSIPPELGYGAQDIKDASGKVVIPANSTILFEVELVKVAEAPAATTPTTPTP